MSSSDLKNFTSYRSFLQAHIHQCKQRRPNWSLGMFAKQLGLKDTSSITKILNGLREPGPSITRRFVRYFNFNEEDARYFKNLILLERMKDDPQLSTALLDRMGKKFQDNSIRIVNEASFQLISDWYFLAVREMVKLGGFKNDANWISKKLRYEILPEQVEHAIRLLIEVGLLKQEDTKLRIENGRFHTGDRLANDAVKNYHESVLDLAKKALRTVEVEKRNFSAVVLTMSSSQIPKAKQMIKEFEANFARLMEDPSGDLTTQIQTQFFPLTHNEVM